MPRRAGRGVGPADALPELVFFADGDDAVAALLEDVGAIVARPPAT